MWWIGIAVILVFLLASWSRKQKQKAAVAGIRTHFPHIARLRLVAACPGLDGVLQEAELRMLFDWILLQLYGRTQTADFGSLMRWTIEHGETETLQLVADVSRSAVDRLSAPVLQAIDGCQGRLWAAVIIDQALSEAGERISPELARNYV
jgi:hypothetical protein